MSDSERVAREMAQALHDNNMAEAANRPIGGDGPNSAFGAGIGNLGGWVMVAGMLGAIVGGIMGQGLAGALFGGLAAAGLVWVPITFLRRGSEGGASRTSVVLWTLGGGVAGMISAVAVALVWDIAFLKELNVENMIVNYGLFGAIGAAWVKLRKR